MLAMLADVRRWVSEVLAKAGYQPSIHRGRYQGFDTIAIEMASSIEPSGIDGIGKNKPSHQ